MAVQKSNDWFDWCDDITKVRTNFSAEEAVSDFKKKMQIYAGAEKNFLKFISGLSFDQFELRGCYIPVYIANITATYDWDEEKKETKGDYEITTTTHHTDTYTFSRTTSKINGDLYIDKFVGRNDQRFYELSHPDDLPYSVPSDYCVASFEMRDYVYDQAERYQKGDVTVNRWSCEAYFVPVLIMSYKYNDITYDTLFNLHNGEFEADYPRSAKAKSAAKTFHIISIVLKILTIPLVLWSLLEWLSIIGTSFWWWLLCGVVAIPIEIFAGIAYVEALSHNKYYFSDYVGKNGPDGVSAISKELIAFITTTVVTIALTILGEFVF